MDKTLIKLTDVVKTYKTEAGDFSALSHVDLTISSGEFVGIIGKSGSGKSTLINMITGIDRATSGHAVINGTDITKLDEGEMAVWRGRNLGIVFQFFQLLPTLTVAENIMLPMDFCNMYKPAQRLDKAMELLNIVDLADQANKFPSQLSGGQQQRIAIARSLANDPPIVCADEPTGNLDSRTAEQIFTLFQSLVDGGKTIIMVTHDRDLAKKVSRTILIADGQVIEEYLVSTFSTLSSQQLAWVSSQITTKNYKPGEQVLAEDQLSTNFYVVITGEVEIVVSKRGKETIVDRVSRGQYFGEIELFHSVKSVASARAGKDGARIGIIDKNTFYKILENAPQLKAVLEKRAQERLAENRETRAR